MGAAANGAGARRTLLITGCSSGIGLDAARSLQARGWRVFATCRQEADCARLCAEGLESFRLDLTDEASIAAAVDEAMARAGRIDALFNNGAIALPGAVEDLPADGLRALFETNLFGWHALTRRVLPVMRAQGGGRIVQCSSVLGFAALRWRGAYVASKFALEGLSDVLRLEMAGTGIHVILIQPGPITSRLRQNAVAHFERWIDWEASPRAEEYRTRLRKRLYAEVGRDAFELPPSAVSAALVRALESARPRARYRVTTPTHALALARWLLPARALDALLRRAGG